MRQFSSGHRSFVALSCAVIFLSRACLAETMSFEPDRPRLSDEFQFALSPNHREIVLAVIARQGWTGPWRVMVEPAKKRVRAGEWVTVSLRIENVTQTSQQVGVWTCSWWEQWRADTSEVEFQRTDCWRNFVEDRTVAPKGCLAWTCRFRVRPEYSKGDLSFRVGFTPLPNHEAVWSEVVMVEIILI